MHIVIADNQAQHRTALRLLLEAEEGMRVVGEADEAELLLATVGLTHPDLVLLDWALPGLRSTALLPALRLLSPGVKIIALGGRAETQQIALTAGVDGFISKGDPPERVLTTLRAIISAAPQDGNPA